MMAFCTNCGNPLPDGVKFCPDCGAQVDPPESPPPSQQTQPFYTPGALKAAKGKKPANKKLLFIMGGVVLAGITALVLILTSGGKEPQGPAKYIGTWTCTGVSMLGMEMDTAGVLEGDFTLEILDTGRYKMEYDGSHHNSFWEADETNITIQSGTDKWTGAWQADGTIFFEDLFDMEAGMTFTKTAGGIEASNDPMMGEWVCTQYSYQGQQPTDAATLFQQGCSITLGDKKKCVIIVDVFEENVKWEQDGDTIKITGSKLFKSGLTIKNDTLQGEYSDSGVTLTFVKEGIAWAGGAPLADSTASTDSAAPAGGAASANAAQSIPQAQLDKFNGDWYGILSFENGTGSLEQFNGGIASTFVRINMSPDGTGVFFAIPYIDGGEALFDLRPTIVGDELAFTGTFWGESVDDWDWTFYESYDGMYRIIGGHMKDDGMIDVDLRVRRWGEYWNEMDGETIVSKDEVDWYKSLTPEELMEAFGFDPAILKK